MSLYSGKHVFNFDENRVVAMGKSSYEVVNLCCLGSFHDVARVAIFHTRNNFPDRTVHQVKRLRQIADASAEGTSFPQICAVAVKVGAAGGWSCDTHKRPGQCCSKADLIPGNEVLAPQDG